MRQWMGSALVQIMTCRLFGAKPLSKPMLGYCQRTPGTNYRNFFRIIQNVLFIKMHLKISSVKWQPFCLRGDKLRPVVGYHSSEVSWRSLSAAGLYCVWPSFTNHLQGNVAWFWALTLTIKLNLKHGKAGCHWTWGLNILTSNYSGHFYIVLVF